MGDMVKMFQGQCVQADAGGTELLAFAEYPDLEKAADRTAAKIKEGFMEMGYILKVARDTDILAGSGYGNHEEFAEKRYGLDKGTVSRYIRIVERFSVGGNSHMLQESYKNIGFAKLSLMLHMPDAIAEEITESYSKQEVQAIKEEIDAERAVSDIEVAIEDAETPEGKKTGSLLERALCQLGEEQPGIRRKLYGACRKEAGLLPALLGILAPQGDAIYMVRVPGVGRLMISISGESASVTSVRSGEKERYTPEDIREAVLGMMHGAGAEESRQQEYGEPLEPAGKSFPGDEGKAPGEKGEAAPVQPKEKRKESRVVKAVPTKSPAKKAVKVTGEEMHQEPEEEPLPGQMEVMDYPEAIPDAHFEEITEAVPPEPSGTGYRKDMPLEETVQEEIPQETLPGEEPGMAAGVRAEPEEVAEDAGCSMPSTLGAGREVSADMPCYGMEAFRDIRMDADGHLESLRKTFAVWDKEITLDILERAHRNAVDLAAAIEKLMDIRRDAAERSVRF